MRDQYLLFKHLERHAHIFPLRRFLDIVCPALYESLSSSDTPREKVRRRFDLFARSEFASLGRRK